MHNTRYVMKVLNRTQKLQEVVARKSLIKTAFFIPNLDEGKEITLLYELKDDEKDLYRFSARFDDDLSLTIILD